jgi:ribosomal protein S18 acetylase RimI-like enzyme
LRDASVRFYGSAPVLEFKQMSVPSPNTSSGLPPIPVTVRSFRPEDCAACRTLFVEGLIGGKIAENDTGLDIDDIPTAYMSSPDNHFWIAENKQGEIVGMIGVQQHEKSTGEIRRLRVRQDHRRRGIGFALMEAAVRFCKERQYVKITLDTYLDREPAIRLFEKLHFKHSRTRKVGEKELLYFYLDLYSSDRPREKNQP